MRGADVRSHQEGERWWAWIVCGLVILALALRLYDLTGESLWYDEAYSVWISDMDIGSLRILWEWKIQFPLYYLLFHYWLRLFGQGEWAVRLFGALAGVATILPMYWLGKELFDRRVGALGALLLAVNPYHVWYSQEVRLHSWGVLLAVLSLYAFWRSMQSGRWGWLVGYALVTGLGLHVHYYLAWIVVVENVCYLLHWRRQRWDRPSLCRWAFAQLVVLALAIPAAVVFVERFYALRDWSWLEANYRAPGLRDAVGLLEAYVLGMAFPGPKAARWAILLVFLALAGWGSLAYGRKVSCEGAEKREGWELAVFALALPVALIFILGQFAALWVIRYLLLFLPAFLLWVALGVRALPWRALRLVATVALVAASFYALSGMYGRQQKEDWRGVAAHIAARAGQDDLIVLMDEECRVPFSYYYGSKGARVEVSRFADGAALDRAVAEIRRRQKGGNLWLVVSHAQSAGLEERLEAVEGLHWVEATEFVGIRLVRYAWS